MTNDDGRKLVGIFEEITSKLVESTDPNRLYDAAVQIAMDTTGAQACSLYLEQNVTDVEKEPGIIVMVSGAGFESLRKGVTYRPGQGLTGRIWLTSQSVKLDSREEIEDPARGWLGLHNLELLDRMPDWVSYSLIGVPLRIGERTIGVLKVENKNPGPPALFSVEEQILLETIASTIALAIENQRYSEQSYGLVLSALRGMSEMLVAEGPISFEMLCARIVEMCIDVYNAEACSLYIQDTTDPDFIEMVSGAGYERFRVGVRYRREQGLSGSIWASSKSLRCDTREQVEDPVKGWVGLHNSLVKTRQPDWECCSLIGVPLRIGIRTIGVLKVENKKPVKLSHFTHNELRSLEIVASNIAVALEMRRRQDAVFRQGQQAREFTHNLGNKVQSANVAVASALDDLADHPGLPEAPIEQLGIARRTLEEIDRLRKDALARSKKERNRSTVSVNSILRDIVDRCRVLEPEGIRIVTTELESDAYAHVDPEQVLLAFDRLIENAADAMKHSQDKLVWIEARRQPDPISPVDKVLLLLVDNGPGFNALQRKQFEENRAILRSKGPSLGAGLNIADRLFADNGIYLRIIDPPWHLPAGGAAFQIEIPVFEPRRLKVLAMDDDSSYLGLLQIEARKSSEIQLDTRGGPDLVLEAAKGSPPALNELDQYDLILLDCFFADVRVDGPEMIRWLRDVNPRLADRIVLMSGHDEYRSRRDIVDKYAEILQKAPMSLQELAKHRG
jgi:GAF domain-containing protein/CheY-like chemotaxis protein